MENMKGGNWSMKMALIPCVNICLKMFLVIYNAVGFILPAKQLSRCCFFDTDLTGDTASH
jgi:hypothetical protein